MRLSLKLYRMLLRFYPAGFRENYGVPLERQFKDDYSEVVDRRGLVRFWLRTLLDFARTMPAQLAREIRQDTRYTVRSWRRRPLPAAFAITALAIAIGANTGVFSVLNALLLRSLPFHEPDRVASLEMASSPGTAPAFHAWRQQSAFLEDAARYNSMEVNVDSVHASSRLRLTETSWNFFAVLGSQPVVGRTFAADEDTPGRDAVAVIGYGVWQQLLGGDPGALGSTIRVNGTPLTVVGIAPPGFDYPNQTAVWSPSTFDLSHIPKTDSAIFFATIGRLKSGLSWAQARRACETEAYAKSPEARNADAHNRPALVPIQEHLAGPVKNASLILMAGVTLLLLMACTSIANLMLGRTAARSNELRIRTALGASRARLIQQLLTESVLLSAAAALIGLLIANWTTGIATSIQPPPLAGQAYTILDWRVLGFTTALSLVTGVVFGVGPAFCVGSTATATPGPAAASSLRVRRARNALIAAQIAVGVVLFTGSIALGRAFIALLRTDNGFEIASTATVSVSLAGTAQQNGGAGYYSDVLRRVREVPGVISASATESLPLGTNAFSRWGFNLESTASPAPATLIRIAPQYFQTMGIRVLDGREFDDHDVAGSEPVAVVNDSFARLFGGPKAVTGRLLTSPQFQTRKIVGVVQAMRYGGPSFAVASPQVFFLSRSPTAATIVARVNGRARDRLAAIRDAVQSVDPKVPIFHVKTMEQRLDEALARPRFYTTAVVFFGGLALLLAIIGVYGVVSYAVVQRTREMGIRLALGTTPARLRAAVLRQGFATVALGVLPGVWGAIVGGRYLQTLVQGADSGIAATSAVAVAITTATAAAATWSATRHIARLDITDVLRAESAE